MLSNTMGYTSARNALAYSGRIHGRGVARPAGLRGATAQLPATSQGGVPWQVNKKASTRSYLQE